jgi:hypothetical protein
MLFSAGRRQGKSSATLFQHPYSPLQRPYWRLLHRSTTQHLLTALPCPLFTSHPLSPTIYISPNNNSAHSLALPFISPFYPSTYTIRPTILRNRTRVPDARTARSAVATREHVGDGRGRGCGGGEGEDGDEGEEGGELHRGIGDVGVT